MSARRTVSRLCLATALVGGLAFAGAALPASAAGEPDGLYSVSNDGEAEHNGFVQLDKTNAAATAIGPVSELYVFTSVEVVNGVGYAIGYIPSDDEGGDVVAVFTWDITTGAVLSALAATVEGAPSPELMALDTTSDGTFLTYIRSTMEAPAWIASIDFATGVVTPLLSTSVAGDNRIFEGLATNPVTGVTWALADYDDGIPAASPVDLAAGTIGDSVLYEEIAASLGAGWFIEGDFDSTGVLWFTYSQAGVSRTDGEIDVNVEATELGTPDIESKALTVGQTVVLPAPPAPPAAPQLAATGYEVGTIAAGALALLGAGAALVATRRRARA